MKIIGLYLVIIFYKNNNNFKAKNFSVENFTMNDNIHFFKTFYLNFF